ncbi:DUF4259 domain-containing protein [Streptomyces griseocarneus]|uniref:DUF4259 domain-containing protein n=1 Tax=Streptomyces griseocarneus TaxID=51201 RepID=UPI00167C79B2|nr:DUF4259 domain-containing protein [Streptomyces griseocarneus]MBZ6474273.1 DUF4259 domain-containing protein [Streptomyces griseocarneus]GHG53014.1 hypothetical protein GCM10018779_14680 [Streptomyces griseocarneus]
MGTWGSGPFDSDTAEDFLDELEEQSAPQRLAVVERTFRFAIEGGGSSSSSVLPEEVMAAAALVAANIPAGRSLTWNEECPGIVEWLAKPVTPALASSAIQALEAALPVDGWFWRSWVDAEEKFEAQAAIDRLRSVLRPASEGESR